ncbi:disease resistance protein RPM1-like [Hibiscus syriacus]|nr:disease resistance protein RPM1-like [Hibiscus syriacus]
MGGLGKTTLVANTFNKQVVKQHFDCCAWVTVSQQYVVTDLLKGLYNKSKEKMDPVINLDFMSYLELLEELVNFLQPRRYLIVIDDVWSTNLWQDISIALPANMKGSRILLATRKEDVASFEFGVVKHIFPLKHLPFDDSIALFWKKAFVGKGGHCPPYLEPSARKLVAKCQGLPLAIVALGGLMASKSSIAEWDGVYNNLNRELSVSCCGEIPIRVDLQRLASGCEQEWIGEARALEMHDILREFAVSISKSVKLVAKSDGKEEVKDDGTRRWSIEAKGNELKAASETALSRVRALFVFAVDGTSKSSFNKLPSGFKLMRVLDLEDTPIKEPPDELMNLFNLRYLSLTRTQVKELPNSIGKLYNLQSLLMKDTQINELPAGLVKLKNLPLLIAFRCNVNPLAFDNWLGIFTGKSDVYSFGVVLVELLTGRKPVLSDQSDEARSLISYFLMSMQENSLLDIVDSTIVNDDPEKEITATAKLARRCLDLNGKKRPTMKQVAMELETIKASKAGDEIEESDDEESEADEISNLGMPIFLGPRLDQL